jgi:hypothetical protein
MSRQGDALRFEEAVRAELGISGAEFIERWNAGAYQPVPDDVDPSALQRVLMLLRRCAQADG